MVHRRCLLCSHSHKLLCFLSSGILVPKYVPAYAGQALWCTDAVCCVLPAYNRGASQAARMDPVPGRAWPARCTSHHRQACMQAQELTSRLTSSQLYSCETVTKIQFAEQVQWDSRRCTEIHGHFAAQHVHCMWLLTHVHRQSSTTDLARVTRLCQLNGECSIVNMP